MCLLAVAWQVRPGHRLIVAANRDEFYERPAQAAHWWPDHPQVFAGRDLTAGGTWMGSTTDGRFAALTNVRRAEDDEGRTDRPSRGALVSQFLTGTSTARDYAAAIDVSAYNGFNLLVADAGELWWCGTQGSCELLAPGVYGLSNASLDTPWPKTARLTAAMRAALQAEPVDEAALFAALADRSIPADDELPPSDLPIERARQLAACTVVTDDYGTRASSVLLIGDHGMRMVERTLAADGSVASEASSHH
jgi:uncharacterized protein with NRDE domain